MFIELSFYVWTFVGVKISILLEQSENKILLYEDSVDKNEGEGDDEEDVGEVEDELGHVVFRAVPLHIPVSDAHLESFSF